MRFSILCNNLTALGRDELALMARTSIQKVISAYQSVVRDSSVV